MNKMITLTEELVNNILIHNVKKINYLFFSIYDIKELCCLLPRDNLYDFYLYILKKYKYVLCIDNISIKKNIHLLNLICTFKNNKQINFKYSSIGFYHTIKENDITMLNWWFMNDFGILPKYELKTLKQIIAEYVCCNEIFLKIYNNINLQYTKYDLIKLITNEKFEILHFLFCKNFYIFQNFFVVKTLIISNNIDFIKQLQSRFDIRIYIDSILNDMYLYKFISLEMLKYLNTLKNIKINTSYLSYNSRIDILNWFDKIHNRNINKTELEEFIFYAVCSSDRQLLNWLYINSLKKPLKYKIYITQRVFNLINNNLRMYEWFSHRNLI
jgi:hypothetical protein